ncbi:MAG TPA: GxxExxY protein [Cyclobacteriaceae bacterium]|nr:GxxExxY protein [Cyclobacteriaceae bacterium]
MLKFEKLTDEEESIGKAIVNSAYKIHSAMGSGLLEKIYEVCRAHELGNLGLDVVRQLQIPIRYDDILFDEGL